MGPGMPGMTVCRPPPSPGPEGLTHKRPDAATGGAGPDERFRPTAMRAATPHRGGTCRCRRPVLAAGDEFLRLRVERADALLSRTVRPAAGRGRGAGEALASGRPWWSGPVGCTQLGTGVGWVYGWVYGRSDFLRSIGRNRARGASAGPRAGARRRPAGWRGKASYVSPRSACGAGGIRRRQTDGSGRNPGSTGSPHNVVMEPGRSRPARTAPGRPPGDVRGHPE